MPEKLRAVLPHGVMLVASILLWWAATGIDVETGGRISPAVWPKAIIVFMGLLCAWEVVKRLVVAKPRDAGSLIEDLEHAPPEAEGAPAAEAVPEPVVEQHAKLWGGVALVAAYVLLVGWMGFFVTTTLFLAVFPWVGGLRRPWLATALGLGGGLVLVFVFMRVAYISLPLGEGPFRAVSLALMRLLGVT